MRRFLPIIVAVFAALIFSAAPAQATPQAQGGQQYTRHYTSHKCWYHKPHYWHGKWIRGHYHCPGYQKKHHSWHQHKQHHSSGVWDRLARCESGGNWHTNTGNGFHGGLQFHPDTWRAYGGHGSASSASRDEQIRVAERVRNGQGWGAWPACSKKLHLR
jgi:Transglycosylase-like domain